MRTIFIPEDPRIRMACVIIEPSEPHTHPILPAMKASFGIKNMYRECVIAAHQENDKSLTALIWSYGHLVPYTGLKILL